MTYGVRFFSIALAGLLLAAPVPGTAAWKAPACGALAEFAADYFPPKGKGNKGKGAARWKLSSTARNLWLPALLQEDRTAALFGAPVLDWTVAEAQAASKHAKTCSRKMRKAKKGADARRLSNLATSFNRRVGMVLRTIEDSEKKLTDLLAALLAAPPSRDTLRATAALSRVKPGGKLDPADWQTLASVTPPYSHGNGALQALRKLPDGRSDEVRPRVQARARALRQPVVDEVTRDLQAAPATLDGIKGLDAVLAATRKELGPALDAADYAALDAAAAARRDAVEAELVEAEIAKLAAAPDGLPGLTAINAVIGGPVAAALSEPRALEIRQAATDRRRVVADALVEAELAKFDALPATFEGLRQFGAVEAAALGRLRSTDTGGAITAFRHGVGGRKAALGRAAFDDFKRILAALPENESGLKQIGRLDRDRQRLLEGSRRSVNEAYAKATAERRERIAEGVAREEARLAKLPLEGGVFADRHGNKFEFRDGGRVYVTVGGQVTTEARYEEDGDRVIIRTPQANMVMERQGSRLTGNGFELRRQTKT